MRSENSTFSNHPEMKAFSLNLSTPGDQKYPQVSSSEVLHREMERRILCFLEKEGISRSEIEDHDDSNSSFVARRTTSLSLKSPTKGVSKLMKRRSQVVPLMS